MLLHTSINRQSHEWLLFWFWTYCMISNFKKYHHMDRCLRLCGNLQCRIISEFKASNKTLPKFFLWCYRALVRYDITWYDSLACLYSWCKVYAEVEKYLFLCTNSYQVHRSHKLCLHSKLCFHCCTEFSVCDTNMPSTLESIVSHVLTTERCRMTTSCFIIKWNICAKYARYVIIRLL